MKKLAKKHISLVRLIQVDIAVHEMLHILGQTHEQSRNDRNRYVKIIWKNVISGHEENFYRVLTYDRNPYDLGSIMQYEPLVKKNKMVLLNSVINRFYK